MCSMSVLCPLCAVPSFGSIDALQQRLIKAANGPLACPFPQCQELFLGLDKLTIHLFTHTSLMTMPEDPPPAATPKRKVKKTKQAAIKNQKDAEPSLPSVSPKTPPALVSCDICEFNFSNCELRDMHFRLVHENVSEETSGPSGSISGAQTTQEPYKCHLCAKTFKMKGSLRVHLKVVHMMGRLPYVNNTPKLNICERIRHKEEEASTKATTTAAAHTVSSPYAQQQLPSAAGQQVLTGDALENIKVESPGSGDGNTKLWSCDVCSKSFTTKYFLKKHKRLHTGEMPYTCEICARTFTFQQSYHKHLLYHSEAKPHVCSVCGRAFKELSTLHNHERIHSGEKPFHCEVCGKSFRQRVSFLVHTRIHTGAMPYKCELCSKSFRYKVSQRTHKCTPLTPNETEPPAESPEQFIKAFLECNTNSNDAQQSPASAEIAAININREQNEEAMLSKAIDDIVVESCQKLGIGADTMTQQQQQQHQGSCRVEGISNSPSEELQRLRLYSPHNETLSLLPPLPADDAPVSELFGRFLMDSS